MQREALILIHNILKLPFKRRYGVRLVLRREHIRRFLVNNFRVAAS
ncbi:MAG: hypothetical protein QI199_04545 [Candidatus Korarchaeota archaeon]|nr:hypothetical protein [Candidatus Korarchaeota archaeon]